MSELKKINDLCYKRGITISDLADKIGVNKTTLYRSISSGEIKLSNLKKIASVLEVSILVFFDEADGMLDLEEIVKLKQRIKDLESALNRAEEVISYRNKLELMATKQILAMFGISDLLIIKDLEGKSFAEIINDLMDEPEYQKIKFWIHDEITQLIDELRKKGELKKKN